jgi:hypothetical protein
MTILSPLTGFSITWPLAAIRTYRVALGRQRRAPASPWATTWKFLAVGGTAQTGCWLVRQRHHVLLLERFFDHRPFSLGPRSFVRSSAIGPGMLLGITIWSARFTSTS